MHFQTKQEILPDIPQENTTQTQSMYEQLRRTSQKWFTRSHKRIFDPHRSKHFSSIQQNQLNYSQRVIPFELNQKAGPGTGEQSKIINLMRQQIEINCQLYVSKMTKLLQEQAKKIKMLGDMLIKNQIQLNNKNQIIEQMTLKMSQMRQKSYSNRQTEDSLQKLIQKRVFQLEQMLRQITKMPRTKFSERVAKVQSQLKETSEKLSKRVYATLQQLREGIEQRMDRVQKVLQMNTNSNLGMRSSVSKSKPYKGDEIQRKNSLLFQEIQNLKQDIQYFKQKKFKYENYKFEEVQAKIQNLQQKIKSMENKSDRNSSKISNNAILALKSSQTTHLTRTEAPQDHTSSKSRFINKYKSLINNRKQRQEVFSSESSAESEVQQTIVHDQEENTQRFLRLVTQAKLKMPIKIEIDQTGYVKSTDTGMYFVDSMGDGFQFRFAQLEKLKERRVIQL